MHKKKTVFSAPITRMVQTKIRILNESGLRGTIMPFTHKNIYSNPAFCFLSFRRKIELDDSFPGYEGTAAVAGQKQKIKNKKKNKKKNTKTKNTNKKINK